eukprot:symbB.v1.2.004378.t1/scaffold246.1/size253235/4
MRALPPSEPTALQRGNSTSDLEGKAAAPPGMDGEDENMEEVECIIEEEEEEEELTHDDIIEDPPNENESVQEVFQDNETLQLLSSDDERECPMSPNFSRAASKVDPPELENTKALQERMEEPPATQPSPGGEEESEKRKGLWDEDVKNGSAFEGWGWNGHPHVETQEQKKKDDDEMEKTIAEMSEELEKALKSEDETEAKDKNTTKGTFKDREPLVQITPVEPTLQEKMKEARKDYPMDSEEAKAEFLKAQGALRQMEKETMLEYEDPDKFFLQEAEEVDGEHPKKSRKGKGRGKGKGKGKGGKGKGKRGGKGAKSKHTPAPAEVAQATEVVEVETSAEAAEAAKAAEVGAETKKPEEEKEKVEPRAQTPQKQRSRKRKQIVSPKLKSPARLAKVLSESAKKKAKVATPEDVKEAKMKNLESLRTSVTDDNSLTYPQEEDFKEQRLVQSRSVAAAFYVMDVQQSTIDNVKAEASISDLQARVVAITALKLVYYALKHEPMIIPT